MNCFIIDTFHRSSLTLYLTNLELYSQTSETKSYEYIFYYIILFICCLHTELVSLSRETAKSSINNEKFTEF